MTAEAVASPVMHREQRHRRVLFLGLVLFMLLSLSPLFGHHIIGAVDWLPATLEHLGPLCMVALHHLLAPIHGVFHILLGVGLGYAVLERSRALIRHARVMRALPMAAAIPSHSALARSAAATGVSLTRLRVVVGSPNPAFTSGWWSPKIYVDADLPRQLSNQELEAVLLHEWAHVRRRDPLRQFAWRTLAAVLFWLPALRSQSWRSRPRYWPTTTRRANGHCRSPPRSCAWRALPHPSRQRSLSNDAIS